MEQVQERVIEAKLGVKFKVPIRERIEQRKQVRPGRLLKLTVMVPELAETLPAYVELDRDDQAKIMAERPLDVSGFFQSTNGGICFTDGGKEREARMLGGGLVGPMYTGAQDLVPAEAFAKIAAAVSDGQFTREELEVFARDRGVLSVLNAGAIDHVNKMLAGLGAKVGPGAESKALAALAKAHVVPGFGSATLQGGREALIEYLRVLLRKAGVHELLDVVAAIMKEVSS